MVKSVVKPLKMGFLRERIVPKKSVFTRAFGGFCFGILWGRCLAPKRRALPTAPHPERVQNAECRVQNAECRMQSAECRMQNAECRVEK